MIPRLISRYLGQISTPAPVGADMVALIQVPVNIAALALLGAPNGPFIAVGGTAPVDDDGNAVGVGDVFAQTKQCLKVINCALEQAGAGVGDIAHARVILTDIDTGNRRSRRARQTVRMRAPSTRSWRSAGS